MTSVNGEGKGAIASTKSRAEEQAGKDQ